MGKYDGIKDHKVWLREAVIYVKLDFSIVGLGK